MPKIRQHDVPSTIRQSFALRLQELRADHGRHLGRGPLSQRAFSELLGIDKDRYGSYERADREPPLEILAKLRKVTGMSLDELIGG
ncbi:helix-turn-helix transcriptional regulator [Lichenicola cladoniae]|uniref:Helix-turn-helix transcriptional regulator n=1 Tax=Lichenicola cladoniae TaxID=1484109 RepID=A0A6M8HU37_9PROT|nr:helix-turn-helix transcriptional regulator [Lichenicola cladoniae]NPD68278.1 helix-turn-helix transcriptional regulator [Acetobacteraceae bacterium]QKE91878.1 helix-turn-helix transcriptional regulator [Lichenicola cladoniae]